VEFDPYRDLPQDHLARLIESVVEECVSVISFDGRPGQPGYDVRLLLKILLYGYCTGIRSSRQLERLCQESMPYMFLTRGAYPGFRTLCTARVEYDSVLKEVWGGLYIVAGRHGLKRLGKIVIDSSKIRADASPESVVGASEYEAVQQELELILREAEIVDTREDQDGGSPGTRVGVVINTPHMRDILRQVRARAAQLKRTAEESKSAASSKTAQTEAAPVEPVQTEAAPVEPVQTEAAPVEPVQTEAAPVEPVQTEAAPVEPVQTEAAPVEPVQTEMAPEEPALFEVDPSKLATDEAVECATDIIEHKSDTEPDGAEPTTREALRITRKMAAHIEAAIQALIAAKTEGLKHVCLTDPDARMMTEGRLKRLQECHSFEAAVDQGLLVAAQTCQEGADNKRLLPLVAAALESEPDGVTAVDADSGYWRGDDVVFLEKSGIDTCIPDGHTACDLHRSQPIGTTKAKMFSNVPLLYDAQTDTYRCPQNNLLALKRIAKRNGATFREYLAKNTCMGCVLTEKCLTQKNAKKRTHKVAVQSEDIAKILGRFKEKEHQERYNDRGAAIETVFGFIRSVLGVNRWQVRGKDKVATEAKLIGCAYQIRKIHSRMLAPS
jgi:hypothetical protein